MISCSKLLGARILYSCGCQHSSGRDVPVKLNKTNLFPILWLFICLSIKDISFIPLKVKPWRQSLENGLSCMFQVIGSILVDKGAEPAWLSISNRAQTLDLKEQTQYGARFGLLWYMFILNLITLLSMFLHPFFSALTLFFCIIFCCYSSNFSFSKSQFYLMYSYSHLCDITFNYDAL